jgi:glucose-1-phosphate thymidylyltransferase
MEAFDSQITGLIPAGGSATRLGEIPCSKEIVPVSADRVASHCLINAFRTADIDSAFFVIAPGKWDIPEFFGSGLDVGLSLGYLVRRLPFGVPFTLDEAFPFVGNRLVAFGFPDILFEPADAFVRLLWRQVETHADVVLGVFPVENPEKWDAVVFDQQGGIERVVPKPHDEVTGYTWILAVWTPAFSSFMHDFVAETTPGVTGEVPKPDVSLGVVVQQALEKGLTLDSVVFEGGHCLDIGTPDDLARAQRGAI